jgi:pimeloyl-ACP methyl ester carboxylesterase
MQHNEKQGNISYQILGRGKPVVLLHGLGASRHDWDLLAPQLAQKGFRCYSLDLTGHGESDKPTDPAFYHIEHLYQDLQSWLESLDIKDTFHLVGHSMGGYLSLLFALRNPERVEAMALVDPLFSPNQFPPYTGFIQQYPGIGAKAMGIAPDWLIFMLSALDPVSSKYFSKKARWRIAEDYKRASPNIIYFTSSIFDLEPDLKQLENPALILWGNHDRTLMPASFSEMLTKLPGAIGKQIHGAGHQPHLSHAKLVNPEISQFLLSSGR